MIRITVKKGSGDKEASQISEPLLNSEYLALIRAKQELADYSRIEKRRTLRIPHDPTLDIDQTISFSIGYLNIFGEHTIEQNILEISPRAIYNTITLMEWLEIP